jgi:L-cysteine S-thiosulfotransferase
MRKPGSTRSRPKRLIEAVLAAGLAGTCFAARATEPLQPFTVIGDAIPASLTGTRGDPTHGRAIVLDRRLGGCLLCHTGPFPEEKLEGTLAPGLNGTGTRWSESQLRLRLVDPTRLNPGTIIPAHYRVDRLTRVGGAWRGKPILSAAQIEDVVAFLLTLRD